MNRKIWIGTFMVIAFAAALFAASKMVYRISPSDCVSCGDCVRVCPKDAIVVENGVYTILPEKCIGCRKCFEACSYDAISGEERQ